MAWGHASNGLPPFLIVSLRFGDGNVLLLLSHGHSKLSLVLLSGWPTTLLILLQFEFATPMRICGNLVKGPIRKPSLYDQRKLRQPSPEGSGDVKDIFHSPMAKPQGHCDDHINKRGFLVATRYHLPLALWQASEAPHNTSVLRARVELWEASP